MMNVYGSIAVTIARKIFRRGVPLPLRLGRGQKKAPPRS
jgi:hypothetical protein